MSRTATPKASFQPTFEALEDRCLMHAASPLANPAAQLLSHASVPALVSVPGPQPSTVLDGIKATGSVARVSSVINTHEQQMAYWELWYGYQAAANNAEYGSKSSDAKQGLSWARAAFSWAQYAYRTGNESAWYTAHTYADQANIYESRDWNNHYNDTYAENAHIYEYYGSNHAFNASLGF